MMQESLPENHLDLYSELLKSKIKERYNPESLKLGHLQRDLYKDRRVDVKSKDVPGIYSDWVARGDPTKIKQDLEHNLLDLAFMAAAYPSPRLFRNGNH